MRTTPRLLAAPTLLTAVLIALVASRASAQAPVDRAAALEMLGAANRWAEIEGALQADGSFLAKEVDIVALEDTTHMQEEEISGVIADLDRRRSSMTLLHYKVFWNEQTKISDANKHRILSSKLDNDVGIKATGRMQPDGTFLARKLRLREPTLSGGKPKHKEELVGPVEVLDAGSGLLRIMKTSIRLKPQCQFYALPVQVDAPKGAGD